MKLISLHVIGPKAEFSDTIWVNMDFVLSIQECEGPATQLVTNAGIIWVHESVDAIRTQIKYGSIT